MRMCKMLKNVTSPASLPEMRGSGRGHTWWKPSCLVGSCMRRWKKSEIGHILWVKIRYILNNSVEICIHTCCNEIYQLLRPGVHVFLKSRKQKCFS